MSGAVCTKAPCSIGFRGFRSHRLHVRFHVSHVSHVREFVKRQNPSECTVDHIDAIYLGVYAASASPGPKRARRGPLGSPD
jgi:hypothetical protein